MKQTPVDPHKYVRLANPSPKWLRRYAERQIAARLQAKPKWYIKEQND